MPKPKRGGRTAANRLPNYTKAVFPKDKGGNYLLNPTKEPNKSKLFKSLGYNMKNANRFEADIRNGLAKNKATLFAPNHHGTEAQVIMDLGITKQTKILTAWIIPKGSSVPSFVTAYKAKVKEDG